MRLPWAHVTEICDEDSLHFITHVQTTLATTTDEAVVEPIHQALSEKSLQPEEHLMDLGYVTAGHLVSAIRKLWNRINEDKTGESNSPA